MHFKSKDDLLKWIWPKKEYNGYNVDTPTMKIDKTPERKVVLKAPFEACKEQTQTKVLRYSIFAIDGIIWGVKYVEN